MGFIAQDVEKVLPEAVDGKKYDYEWKVDSNNTPVTDSSGNLVFTDEPRYRGLDDRSLIAVLTKALQEQIARVDSLEARLEQMQSALAS
jgi:hypothetical protein